MYFTLNFISNHNNTINYQEKINGELKTKCEKFQNQIK